MHIKKNYAFAFLTPIAYLYLFVEANCTVRLCSLMPFFLVHGLICSFSNSVI